MRAVRTTLDLDDHLMRELKQRAAAEGRTLTSLIEEAIQARLAVKPERRTYRLDLPQVDGRRPPAVDVADREALYEFLEDSS